MISSHVTSLETSKRLKELGVSKDTPYYFYWAKSNYSGEYILLSQAEQILQEQKEFADEPGSKGVSDRIPAYLANELGELLPYVVNDLYLTITKFPGGWRCGYNSYETPMFGRSSPFLAEAMGKTLGDLIEDKLITL